MEEQVFSKKKTVLEYDEETGHDELIEKLSELIEDLGFDYDRMSISGQQAYTDICSIVAKLSQ